jgi:uncharacterized protein
MTQAAKAQEPSMEEILASIRRIIADDDSKTEPKAAAAPPPAAAVPAPAAAPPPPREAAPPPPPPPPPAAREEIPKPTKQDGIDELMGDAVRSAPPSNPPQPADVLDLSESMIAPAAPPPAANFKTIDGENDVVFRDADAPLASETRSVPEARPSSRAFEEPPRPAPLERPLLSTATTAAVDSAFNALAHTVLVQNARTLEDLVRDMLRPMLKGWLDDNLPVIVERLVKAEIERVSRGRT